MKKHLMIFAVMLLAVALATPSFAAVEFKYGGQFRARFTSGDNVFDGTETEGFYNNFGQGPQPLTAAHNSDDNRRFIDQRLRLYFTFLASKNLKVVTKFEMGDIVWGNAGSTTTRLGAGSGGGVGADGVNVELKNAYVEFNIPGTPSTGIVGIQTLTLLDSWIVDDDFSAAVLVTKLDPFRLTLGYVAGQYGDNGNNLRYTNEDQNVDSMFASIDWAQGPFKASGIFFWQNAHRTNVSFDPATLTTPTPFGAGKGLNFFQDVSGLHNNISDNNLFDLGFNFTYKVDWLLAYVNFVKNLGSVDFRNPVLVFDGPGGALTGTQDSADYTGFMVDAGVSWFCGPLTLNLTGFYTTGPDFSSVVAENGINDGATPFNGMSSTDVDWFTYPLATSKYFSEIIGGGILGDDLYAYRGYSNGVSAANIGSASGLQTVYWRGYGFPTNLWTISAGAAYQIAEKTKVSASYWYFGTSNKVPVAFTNAAGTNYQMSSDIGHELNFYLDQGIVDGLTLTLVGAYLVAGDAFAPLPIPRALGAAPLTPANYLTPQADDAFELGARLQWNF